MGELGAHGILEALRAFTRLCSRQTHLGLRRRALQRRQACAGRFCVFIMHTRGQPCVVSSLLDAWVLRIKPVTRYAAGKHPNQPGHLTSPFSQDLAAHTDSRFGSFSSRHFCQSQLEQCNGPKCVVCLVTRRYGLGEGWPQARQHLG